MLAPSPPSALDGHVKVTDPQRTQRLRWPRNDKPILPPEPLMGNDDSHQQQSPHTYAAVP